MLNLEEAEKLALKVISNKVHSDDIIPMIIEEDTIVFDWGIIFYWNDKRAITKENTRKLLYGDHRILVDRIASQVIFPRENLFFMDIELEKYRNQKGYPHVIKFPIKLEHKGKGQIVEAIALLSSGEVFQIEQGINLIKEKELFNIHNLIQAKSGLVIENIITHCLKFMSWEGIYWYDSEFEEMPKEIKLMEEFTENISITNSKIKSLPLEILELKNLKSIKICNSPLENMPKDLRSLKNLEKIFLSETKISRSDVNEFLLPDNCLIEIE